MRAACLSLIVAAQLAAVVPVSAVQTCHVVNAKGEGLLTGPTTTESRIIGGGLLQGTTAAGLVFTGVSGDVATYEGTLVLTTRQGTLTLAITDGEFNTVTGEFSNESTVIDGTGRFEGATGALYFHGFVAANGTFFDDEISGHVCVDLP